MCSVLGCPQERFVRTLISNSTTMACLHRVGIWIFLIQLLANSSEGFGARHIFRRKRANRSDGTIVFIDDMQRKDFKPKITEECERIGICENVPGYPENHVRSIVQQIKNSTKFNEDMLDEPGIAQRFGESEQTLSLCRSSDKLIKPKAAKNIKNQWYYVINEVLGADQTYRVEICDQRHKDCNSVATFALSNEPRCQQKFILRSMVALDYDGRPFETHFQVPSCCSCVYKAL